MSEPSSEEKLIAGQLEQSLTTEHLNDAQEGTLYHYTDAAGFVGIVQNRELWATHFRHMNDRSEFETGQKLVDEAAASIEAVEQGLRQALMQEFRKVHDSIPLTKAMPVFVVSFSEKPDLLSQWRAYAAGGGGFSLGFNPLPNPARADHGGALAIALMRVEYDEAKLRATMTAQLRRLLDQSFAFFSANKVSFSPYIGYQIILFMLRQMGLLVPRAKHRAFEEEREWRIIAALPRDGSLVHHRATQRGVTPFVKIPLADGGALPLTGVVVGPLQDPVSGEHGAKSLLKSLGLPADQLVRRSEAPFRG